MKKLALTAALATAVAVSTANASWFAKKPDLKTQMDKVSYTIGYQMGHSFKQQNIKASPIVIMEGIEAGMANKKPAMTQAEMQSTMQAFQKEMVSKMMAKQKAAGIANQKTSDVFMAKIAKAKGIHKIENGLYYKVIKAGHGAKPTAKDHVKVDYTGKLTTGHVFDSTKMHGGKPAVFGVSQVIPGWTKALEQMPVGSTWELYIAPKLAYGKFAPPSIGPNQALIFNVSLLGIVTPKAAPAQPHSPAHPKAVTLKK